MRVWMGLGRCRGGEAVGETQNRPFQLSFNSSLKVDFQGSRVTSDGGLVLVRELDERLDLSALTEQHLIDSGRGKNLQLPFSPPVRIHLAPRVPRTSRNVESRLERKSRQLAVNRR